MHISERKSRFTDFPSKQSCPRGPCATVATCAEVAYLQCAHCTCAHRWLHRFGETVCAAVAPRLVRLSLQGSNLRLLVLTRSCPDFHESCPYPHLFAGSDDILSNLAEFRLAYTIYGSYLENATSEQSSRMQAMDK